MRGFFGRQHKNSRGKKQKLKNIFKIFLLGFGQGGSGCSGKLAPCMCRETHCTCASSPCIFFFVFHPQMIQILDIKSNNFQKNVEFFQFFGFTLCFRTFQAKKNFFFPTRLIEKFRFSMIFDYQSEIVNVFRKNFVKGCILKYYLQNMRISTILDDFLNFV